MIRLSFGTFSLSFVCNLLQADHRYLIVGPPPPSHHRLQCPILDQADGVLKHLSDVVGLPILPRTFISNPKSSSVLHEVLLCSDIRTTRCFNNKTNNNSVIGKTVCCIESNQAMFVAPLAM